MATISLRIDDDTRDELEDMARVEGISVSELLRSGAEALLGRGAARTWTAPASLPKRTRHQLVLLHEVAAALATDESGEAEHHQRVAEVFRSGYTAEYPDAFVGIDDEVPAFECELVWDILDMFRVLKGTMVDLGPKKLNALDEHAEHALTFRGFDLNDTRESRMLGYVRYLMANDRWDDLAEALDPRNDRGNSHSRMLPVYERMLAVFKPIWERLIRGDMRGRTGYTLTADEVAQILEARVHPDNRATRDAKVGRETGRGSGKILT